MSTTTAAPKCPSCGSTKLTVTSSQQYRKIRGKKREVADARCRSCRKQWWSSARAIIALARKADRDFKK